MRSAIAGMLAVALAGCSQEKTVTISSEDGNSTTVTMKNDGSSTTVSSNQGSMTIKQDNTGKFPAFAPQYPGSKVVTTMTMDGGAKGAGGMIAMETSASTTDVLAFYRETFKAAGVPVKMETTTPQGGMIAAGKEPNETGTLITVGNDGGKTTITMMTGTNAGMN